MRNLALVFLLVPIVAFGVAEHQRASTISTKLDDLGGQLAKLAARPLPEAAPLFCPSATASVATPANAAPVAAPIAPRPTERTRAQATALAEAHDTLEGALSRRTLRVDDVMSLRASLGTAADPDEAYEIARRIAMAINKRELVAEDPHFMMP